MSLDDDNIHQSDSFNSWFVWQLALVSIIIFEILEQPFSSCIVTIRLLLVPSQHLVRGSNVFTAI